VALRCLRASTPTPLLGAEPSNLALAPRAARLGLAARPFHAAPSAECRAAAREGEVALGQGRGGAVM